jgi:transposase
MDVVGDPTQHRKMFQKNAIFEAIATLKGIGPLVWLTNVLGRMVSGRTKAHELERLLPWHWKTEQLAVAVNA